MEISKHGSNLNVPATKRSSAIASDATNEVNSGAGVSQSNEVPPQRLTERLQGDVEIRNRLLVEIQAKFHAGEYHTRAAVEKAAEQIVGY